MAPEIVQNGGQGVRDHRKLRAFKLADGLVLAVYEATRKFPRDEQFSLTLQLRRAAISIASNIVEGCARNTESDYLRFLDMEYGSAREVEYQLSLAHRLGYMPPDSNAKIGSMCEETAEVLHGLIRALRK